MVWEMISLKGFPINTYTKITLDGPVVTQRTLNNLKKLVRSARLFHIPNITTIGVNVSEESDFSKTKGNNYKYE